MSVTLPQRRVILDRARLEAASADLPPDWVVQVYEYAARGTEGVCVDIAAWPLNTGRRAHTSWEACLDHDFGLEVQVMVMDIYNGNGIDDLG